MRRATTHLALVIVTTFGLVGSTACTGGGAESPSGSGATAGSSGASTTSTPDRAPATVRVPADHPTIQAAVDAAVPGDLILVSPGTYRESVVIEKERVVLRGLDRAGVVIDGETKRENGIKVLADGVAIENLTVQNHAANGVLVTGDGYDGGRQLQGFRVAYVTALANELYGVYSFAAESGLFDNVYASGSGDAGVYVGRCDPCNTLITHTVAEHNAIGFEGTNASTGLVVASSTWRANRVGITVNSQKLEKKSPQHDAVIVGNVVDGEGAGVSPVQAGGAFGLGIAIGGGRNDLVRANRVINNLGSGLAVTDLDDFIPDGNQLRDNVLAGNAVDIAAYRSAVSELPGGAVCVAGNTGSGGGQPSTSPSDLVATHGCDGPAGPVLTVGGPPVPVAPPGAKAGAIPAPPTSLPNQPDAATAPADPPTGPPLTLDVATMTVPEA